MHGQPAPNGGDDSEAANKKYWFLNIRRYRSLFNVDTDVSAVTVSWSIVGERGWTQTLCTAGYFDQDKRFCHRRLQSRLL